MQTNEKGSSKNLTAVLIALLVLIVVAVFYWDRQRQRELDFRRAKMQKNLYEDLGVRGIMQLRQQLPQTRTVALAGPMTVSYKNIIARIAPSVVSVNVDSANQVSRQAVAWPMVGTSGQTAQFQNVGGQQMGGWAMARAGNLICPSCGTRVPHQRGIPAYAVGCPKCGTQMMREEARDAGSISAQFGPKIQTTPNSVASGASWNCPRCYLSIPCRWGTPRVAIDCPKCGIPMLPGAANVTPVVWGQGMDDQGIVRAGNLICPGCGTRVPHQRGIPAYAVGCPKCGTQMMREEPRDAGSISARFGPKIQTNPNKASSAASWTCPRCYTSIPCRWGTPILTIHCPKCGAQMNPGGNALSGQSAQLAAGNPPPYAWGGPWQQMAVPAPNIQHFQAAGKGGSGVIVNRQGYVLTNHHVVHGARKITVTVSLTTASGQISKTYPAELIDEAPNLDFAVLKIITKGNEQFSPAPIGNSSVVSVGDEVLAIGSPYGLQQSVTLGMVSNTNRSMTVGNRVFNDFIQVDAAINPGSSGGALINVKGELIGLTTAIYSPTQAFSGIGFARPIDQAKAAFPDFIQTRTGVANALVGNMPAWWTAQTQQVANIQNANTQAKVWLGIRVRAVDKDVQSFLELPMGYGVLVMEVFEFSPCHAAGMLPGDVIIRADDRSIKDDNMLEKLLNNKDPGEKMKLTIFRDGTKKKLTPKLSDRPVGFNITPAAFGLGDGLEWLSPPFDGDPLLTAQPVALVAQALAGTNPATARQSLQANVLPSPRQQNAAGKKFIEGHWLGLEVITLTSELASQYQIPQGESGVLVDEVTLEAAESGILAGDIVLSVAGFPTPDLKSFFRATQREPVLEGTSAQLEISRRGRKKTFTMTARNAPILGFAQMEAAQPIQPSALRPHRYMGACTKCHIFMRTGGQLATDAGDILPSPPPITRNAKPPHRDRGSCAACHTLR